MVNCPLYTGFYKTKCNKEEIPKLFFKTYVSSSIKMSVALTFLKNEGMLLIFDGEQYTQNRFLTAADVSWISLYPQECEVLQKKTNLLVLKNTINFI